MAKPDIKEKMRTFLGKYVKEQLDDAQNYFAAGLISSLIAVEMIMFIEQEFSIKVENEDLDLINFNSLNAIEAFVVRKKNEN